MGTALQEPARIRRSPSPVNMACFSPLRYGDSIVGVWSPGESPRRSVPEQFQSPSLWGQHCRRSPRCVQAGGAGEFMRFSPLRYGDSIVGLIACSARSCVYVQLLFQSPSLWGQHCRFRSSPGRPQIPPMAAEFQSPSLWGQHCRLVPRIICLYLPYRGAEGGFQSPFAMGTAL